MYVSKYTRVHATMHACMYMCTVIYSIFAGKSKTSYMKILQRSRYSNRAVNFANHTKMLA